MEKEEKKLALFRATGQSPDPNDLFIPAEFSLASYSSS
jgi:hypothetical protein